MYPACGPPKPSGTPNRWLVPTAMSAPISPGERSRVSASRSAATTASAPRSCAAAIIGPWSRTWPLAPGYCSSTPKNSSSGRPADRSATRTSMPIGSARVCSTARVCGSTSASTRNNGTTGLDAAFAHRHRLGGRGGLVQQTGPGGRQAREVGDHRLEIEQRLEPTLADLRLVRRVGGVPARVLEQPPADHRRGHGVRIAEADHLHHRRVAGAEGAQLVEHLTLGAAAVKGERGAQPDRLGHRLVDQGVQGGPAERGEHLRLGVGIDPDVSVGEGTGGVGLRHRDPAYFTGSATPESRRGCASRQPARPRRRAASSSSGWSSSGSSARSDGRVARVPSRSRQTRPTAIPNTPCPPWTRSTTSSAEVHS